MKTQVLLFIADGNAQKAEAQAFSKESANIYIYAGSWQEVPALLEQGQNLAAEAIENWKPEEVQPEEEPAQDQKHYYTINRSIEEMNEAAQAYEESPAGRLFAKRVDNAVAFYFKHSKGGLLCTQLEYLANKHYNSLLNGSIDLSALAYRTGYNAGKAAAKKWRKDTAICLLT